MQTLFKQLQADLNPKLSVKSLSVVYTAASVDVLKPTATEMAALSAALLLAPEAAKAEIGILKEEYKLHHLDLWPSP